MPPSLPPGRSRLLRVEHEYDRGGWLNYLAALDVHRGRLLGRCEDQTGIAAFERLVADVMAIEPYVSARRVYLVCDNGSSHACKHRSSARKEMAERLLVHIPVHASWLNQIEIVFSILQRRSCPQRSLDLRLADRIVGFERHFNAEPRSFDWRFTRADLEVFLKRLAAHEDLQSAVA